MKKLKSKINLQVNKSADYFIESYEECMPIEYSQMNSISKNNESSANANSPLPLNRKIFDYSKIENIHKEIINMNSSPKNINNSELDEYSN